MERKAKYEADLHCHTTASDGLFTPSEIVVLAAGKGLKALAITDHDTIDGWAEAEKAAMLCGILLIKGIEINTEWEGKEVHILGYGLDGENTGFKTQLKDIREKRAARIKKILEKLEKLQIKISYADVLRYAKGESLGRPHVVQAMVEKGYAAGFKEGFEKYLKIGAPAYVPRYKLTPAQAIRIIRDAGGTAVLAHPGTRVNEAEIQQWMKEGLQGIEATHPDHSFEERIKYLKFAENNGLLATGGSDYHGPSIKPGIELGDWGVGLDIVKKLEQLIK